MWSSFKLRLAVGVLAGILALLVLFLAALHTPPVRHYALKQAVEILAREGVDFDATDLNYNLLNLSATLGHIAVRSRQAPDLPPLATADDVRVSLSLRKLLSGAFYVTDAEIHNPTIHLVVDENGGDNIPHPPKNPNASETDFLIEKLRLSGGSLHVEERRQKIDVVLPSWQVAIDGGRLTKEQDIRLDAQQPGRITFQQRSLAIRSLNAEVVTKKNALDVRNVKLVLEDSTIAISGALNNFDDPRYDVKAETDLALGALSQFAGAPKKVSGTVHASLTVNGPLAQLKATARLNGENLSIERFDKLNLQAVSSYDASTQRVQLESFNVISPAGTIQGKSSVALNTQAGESTLNAAIRSLDLARISNALNLPVRIASRATGEIAAHWPGLAFEQAAGDASARLAAAGATAKNTVPITGAIQVKSTGALTTVGISSLEVLGARLTGRVVMANRREISGDVKLDAEDLTSTIAGAEAFLGRAPGSLAGTKVGGALAAEGKLGGTLQDPTASAIIHTADLQAGTLTGIAVNAAVDYTPSQLAIRSATVDWKDQHIEASGSLGLKGTEPSVNLQAHTASLSIPVLLSAANRSDISGAGTIVLDASVTGTTKNPGAQVNLAVSDLVAYNETFGALSAQAELNHELLTVKQLRLEKPQPGGAGTIDAIGTYRLDSKEYTANLNGRNLRLVSLTLPDGSPVRANLTFQAQGRGSADNPAGSVELSADNVQYRDQQYGAITLNANLANQQADIEAAAPKFNLRAKVNVGVKEPNPVTFEVTASNTSLASLPLQQELPVAGTLTATVRGSGDLKNYERGQASAEISKLDITYNGQPLRANGPLVARYDNQVLTIDRATVVAGDSRIAIDGKLPLDAAAAPGVIHISSTLDLKSLSAYLPKQEKLVALGKATVTGAIAGTLKSIDPNLAIALENGFLSGPSIDPPISNLTLKAQVRNGALELETVSGDIGPAAFQASGEVPFALLPADLPVSLPRRRGPGYFTADLKELDLASFSGKAKDMTGSVSLHVEAQAPKPELAALTARITLPTLRVGLGTYHLQQDGVSTISVANGTARIDQFQLTGPQTDVRLSGTAGLTGPNPLDLRLDGKLDASIAGAFTDAIRARGATEIQVAVTGSAQSPQAQGHIELADAQLSMVRPRLAIEGLNARIELTGARANLSKLEGTLNGGSLTGGGSLEYANGLLTNTNLNVKGSGVYLDFPQGLKTVSNLDISVRSNPANDLVVGGSVLITEGGFTDDLNVDTGILAAISAPRGIELTEEQSPLLSRIHFDIGVKTENPLYVKNNLAKAEVTADLRVLGNPYQPGLSGRLSIEEGGTLTLNERTYTVERGNILFTNERRIEPTLDILATTKVGEYDISLQINGTTGKTETTLTSDPTLPEPDILAVLLTGKKLDEIRGQEFEVARNQVLSYLTGRVGSSLGRGISGATGLSTVRIEPNLIANETDPSARLTVGQDITTKLNLIYSMDLIDSSDQIYSAEYDISRRFSTRGIRQSDGSFRADFSHDLRFGGIPEPRRMPRQQQRQVGSISIMGHTHFTDLQLAPKLGVKPGGKYDFFKVRRGLDRINQMYAKDNLLEASVRLNRENKDHTVDLTLNVNAGPAVDFVYKGIDVGGGVKKKVREIWQRGVFDTQRAEESVAEIKAWLVDERYLQSKIEYTIAHPTPDRKSIVFDIQAGPKFGDVSLEFEGASGVNPEDLRKVVKTQKLSTDVYIKPGRVTELLSRYYQEQGYLDAKISDPQYQLDAQTRTGKVVFPVQEGALYKIGDVIFEGNSAIDTAKLVAAVPLPKGEEYHPVLRERVIQKIQDLYWEQGYNDMESGLSTRRNPNAGMLDVIVKITENRQEVVSEIVIGGFDKTNENLIRSQIEVKPSDILNLQKLSKSRRNLYNTGAYSLVEMTHDEIEPQTRGKKNVRLNVKVREVQPFELRYGGFYDTERGPGVLSDLTNRNSLGSARTLGLRVRYDAQLQEARLYFTQPLLRRFPVSTTASPFIRREQNPETSTADAFNVDRVGFSIQQEARFHAKYILSYGYRIEKSRTYDVGPDPLFDIPLRVAGLTSSVTRETRDDLLDATRGDFISHAFQFSPEILGSQLRFFKYFGQYFRYFPLQKPKVELFTNEIRRPRLVYAAGVRLGLAKGLGGQEIPLSQRFFAGGSTTIRGFEQNGVGPVGVDRIPLGGNAMLIINNEIRFPLIYKFDGVGFLDVGNVYEHTSDISFSDIRKAAGLGLRLHTPWFLLRLDYGVKLDRRSGEPRGRVFFSIGQAF